MSDVLNVLLKQLNEAPETIEFNQVISFIDANYDYSPTSFSNGEGDSKVINEAGTNEGSCKIFAFARLNDLSEQQTLSCFGDYYREDVLQHPEGTDHGNIRNFIKYAWAGVIFSGVALKAK